MADFEPHTCRNLPATSLGQPPPQPSFSLQAGPAGSSGQQLEWHKEVIDQQKADTELYVLTRLRCVLTSSSFLGDRSGTRYLLFLPSLSLFFLINGIDLLF